LFSVDPELEGAQTKRLAAWKSRRSSERVAQALARLEAAARGDANVLPPMVEAVRAEATLGEMSDILRRVFGTFDSAAPPPPPR